MNISQKGIDFIKKYEGLQLKPYKCPAGKWTIGYGHVTTAEKYDIITEETAEQLLLEDIKTAENVINSVVSIPLKQCQFDALVSLVYNIGNKQFLKSKGLTFLNNKDLKNTVIEFFSKEKGFVNVKSKPNQGLINRRQDEWNVFLC
jgi:lysozyme